MEGHSWRELTIRRVAERLAGYLFVKTTVQPSIEIRPLHGRLLRKALMFARLWRLRRAQSWLRRVDCIGHPLVTAAWLGDEATVLALLEKGAFLDRTTLVGYTPLMVAAETGNLSLISLFLRGASDPVIPTFQALITGQDEAFRILLDAYPSGTDPKPTLSAMLRYAAFLDRAEPIRLLMQLGVHDSEALEAAAESGGSLAAQVLLEGGADVNAVSTKGWSPLGRAVQHGNEELVAKFLSCGADPNLVIGDRSTPLLLAARLGSAGIVASLLAHGADRTYRDATGSDASTLARRHRHPSVVALLEGRAG